MAAPRAHDHGDVHAVHAVDVGPAAQRGAGLGTVLLLQHLACLRSRGVKGVQLSATRENLAAVHLCEKVGFIVARDRSSPLWRPWLGHEAIHLAMTRRL